MIEEHTSYLLATHVADSLGEAQKEWEQLVGRLILSFGEIELITIKLSVYLSLSETLEKAADKTFNQRVNSIIQHLRANPAPESLDTTSLTDMLGRAKKLAHDRNLIAHNPLAASFYEDRPSGGIIFEHRVYSPRDATKWFDLAALKEVEADITNLASELYLTSLKFMAPESNDYSDCGSLE